MLPISLMLTIIYFIVGDLPFFLLLGAVILLLITTEVAAVGIVGQLEIVVDLVVLDWDAVTGQDVAVVDQYLVLHAVRRVEIWVFLLGFGVCVCVILGWLLFFLF